MYSRINRSKQQIIPQSKLSLYKVVRENVCGKKARYMLKRSSALKDYKESEISPMIFFIKYKVSPLPCRNKEKDQPQ